MSDEKQVQKQVQREMQKDPSRSPRKSKRPEKKFLASSERDDYERKLAVKDEVIRQLDETLEKQKQTGMAMAADYKGRLDKLQTENKGLLERIEYLTELIPPEREKSNQDRAKLNAEHGAIVKELRQRIAGLEAGDERATIVAELRADLEDARRRAASIEQSRNEQCVRLDHEIAALKCELKKKSLVRSQQ